MGSESVLTGVVVIENLYDMKSARPTEPSATPRQVKLTPRQLEVLALLCEGLPNKLIARRLDMASGTVKVHVVRILRALSVTNRLQAALEAGRLGLLEQAVRDAGASAGTVMPPKQLVDGRTGPVGAAGCEALVSNVERAEAVTAA